MSKWEKQMERMRRNPPPFHGIHPLDAPLECGHLLWASFASRSMFLLFGAEDHGRWAKELPAGRMAEAYAYHRRQLQLLTWMQPGTHWVLKAPEHTHNLPTLLSEYPDARIVQMNRATSEVLPSLCSLTYYAQHLTIRNVTAESIGRETIERIGRSARASRAESRAAARELAAPGQIYELEFTELMKDPVAATEGIYAHFGMEVPADMKPALAAWMGRNHGDKRPRHKYSLEMFGLTEADVEKAFGEG
jgi:hypothetical protein